MDATSATRSIGAAEIESLCSFDEAITSQRQVFLAHEAKQTVLGPRAMISQGENAQFAYIARASETGPTIVKFGTVVPSNTSRSIPVVQTNIAVMDPTTGSVTTFLDGESVTKLRTVAASIVAAQALANPPTRVAIVGLGHQGLAHAHAVAKIFKPRELIGIARNPESNSFSESGAVKFFSSVTSEISALRECDLIFLCTNSATPVIKEEIPEGGTCISIGSFAPNRSEVAPELIAAADQVVVDDVEISSAQCGGVKGALEISNRNWSSVRSLGSALSGAGRKSPSERIYFFSVGLGIQDAAIAEIILNKLSKRG